MTALFQDPVLVKVTEAESGTIQIVALHRGVTSTRRTDPENAKQALAVHMAKLSNAAGRELGVVVFNNAVQGIEPVSFLVASDVATRSVREDELTEAQEKDWEHKHKAWAKENRVPRRRLVPAAVASDREDSPALPRGEEVPPADWSRLKPAVPAAPPERDRVMVDPEPEKVVVRGDVMAEHHPVVEAMGGQPVPVAKPRLHVRDLDSLMDRGKHVQHATDGWRGALNAAGLNLAPGADEQERRKLITSIQKGWKGTKYAALLNEKGSVGKTPDSLMLAAAIKRYRAGGVIVRDGNPSGNAHERAEYAEPLGRREDGTVLTEKDLAERYARHGVPDQPTIADYLYTHTTDGYQLLTHYESLDDADPMTPDEVDDVYEAVEPHAVCVITDTGNSPWEPRDLVMLDRLDQLVVPFLTYPDRENGARKTLERLEKLQGGKYQPLVENAVMVVNVAEDNREHRRRAEQWADRWAKVVRDVQVVPYDAHLASHSLRFDDLRLPTRTAFLRIAESVVQGFRGV